MEKKKEELLAKLSEMEKKFRKRTLAFGIAKREATRTKKEAKVLGEENKLLSLALYEVVEALLNKQWCEKCRSIADEVLTQMVTLSQETIRTAMKHLSAEETFTLMQMLDNPKFRTEESE